MIHRLWTWYVDACVVGVSAFIGSVIGFGAYAYWRLATKGDE
jgi:hypothetical protein